MPVSDVIAKQINEAKLAITQAAIAEFEVIKGTIPAHAQDNILKASVDRAELMIRVQFGEPLEAELKVCDATLIQYKAVAVMIFARAAGRALTLAGDVLATFARGLLKGLVGGGL